MFVLFKPFNARSHKFARSQYLCNLSESFWCLNSLSRITRNWSLDPPCGPLPLLILTFVEKPQSYLTSRFAALMYFVFCSIFAGGLLGEWCSQLCLKMYKKYAPTYVVQSLLVWLLTRPKSSNFSSDTIKNALFESKI